MLFVILAILIIAVIASMLIYVGMNPIILFDLPGLIVVILTVVLSLVSTKSLKDFSLGFKIACSKKEFSDEQKERSKKAINLIIQNLFCMCAVISLVTVLIYFNHNDDDKRWIVCLATSICSTLYSSLLTVFFAAIKNKLAQ